MDFQIKAVEEYVEKLLTNNLPATMSFHGIEHTLRVKKAASNLAKAENVN